MAEGYKTDKEAFVAGMTGSSIMHVNLVSLITLASVSLKLYATIQTRLQPTRTLGFLPSWLFLVLPLLLSMTLSANQPTILLVLLSVSTGLLLCLPKLESGTPLPSRQPLGPSVSTSINPVRIPPLPALTTYRAHMMLMTVLAILAVDFPVFPRSLAKCETFGISLMDLGVGSFVFSQGIVSAIQLIKDPTYLTSPIMPKLLRVTRKSFPIIVLGLVRVILVKGTDYPEHETEYGRHWNFFITLALLPILQVLFHPLLLHFPIALVAILLGMSQQFALSHLGLRDYLVFAPRTSLISANKEGIISLPGYLAIQLLGLSVGTIILPPYSSFFHRRQKVPTGREYKQRNSDAAADNTNLDIAAPRQTEKTATELCSYAIIWWSFMWRLLKPFFTESFPLIVPFSPLRWISQL
ncbi:hypothetical protein BYT27DRAFT_7116401 [Phlegmacium glaucopus]|nr:hypothetical protein BYT27DRAFT_7116401 [Phlegmacium glaucopus]